MRLRYNSPVILTYTLLATFVFLLFDYVSPDINVFFAVPGVLTGAATDYIGIFSHILGHASWDHFISNFSLILLIGPILEEKYGSAKMILMILVTALITGVLNLMLFDTGLLGASGIVFMMILLSSITNYHNGDIPITFLLVVILYLGKELLGVFEDDQVSQFGHIIGGVCGGVFGFILNKDHPSNQSSRSSKSSKTKSSATKPSLEPLTYDDELDKPTDAKGLADREIKHQGKQE